MVGVFFVFGVVVEEVVCVLFVFFFVDVVNFFDLLWVGVCVVILGIFGFGLVILC